jgi:hypothetical protein
MRGRSRHARDFFISYPSADQRYAEWIAWELEAAGYTTFVQAWDFGPDTTSSIRCSRGNPERAIRKRKEPVLIRFDEHTLEQVDRAAAKRNSA